MKKKIRFDRETIVDLSGKSIIVLLKASVPILVIFCAVVVFIIISRSLFQQSTPEQLAFINNYQVGSQAQTLITFGALVGIFIGFVSTHISHTMISFADRYERYKERKLIRSWLKRKARAQLEPLKPKESAIHGHVRDF